MIGAVLGNYRIIGELSSGGMGTVFRAEHDILKRPAAVKLLRPELTANDELVERFFNEAKAATAIRHPGIVEVYDFGYTDQGHAYLVMEFLEGRALGKQLEAVGRFTEWEAANIARGIASALKAAHAKGIVHRDLKPDNVFLVPDLEGPTGGVRAKVLDFGIAKLADTQSNMRHTQTGVLMGTPLYMAPEQARAAGQIDHRADLYSLGCILYEMLVGQPPFVAEGAGEIIAMQMFAQPEPPSARLSDISPEMERIVMRLLAKEPHERFQSAGELVNALGAIGTRLSAELVALMPSTGSHPQLRVSTVRTPANGLRISLIDEAPPAPKRSTMPIIAGAITVAIVVVAVVAFVVTRAPSDSSIDDKPNVEPRPVVEPVVTPPDEPKLLDPMGPQVKPPDDRAKPPDEPVVVDPAAKPIKRPVVKGARPGVGSGSGSAKPNGPTTPTGAPIEPDLDDKPKRKAP